MTDAAPQQPSAEGRRFSYVMGGPDPFDQADKGWLGVAEVTEDKPPPKPIPQVSASAEDDTDGSEEEEEEEVKQKAWKKNEDIPMRFDEISTEEKWVNVSDVIRRQREEQARQEAKQKKLRPPPDPEESRPRAPSDADDDGAARRGNRERKEYSDRLRKREESDDYQEDAPGVDAITESMLQFALAPGLMVKDRGLARRSSLPATPTAYGRLDRSSFWTAAGRPPRRSSFTEEEDERPPPQHRPREQHVRRGRSPRHSFSEDKETERPHYREPSPDYDLEETSPRSAYRREYEPGRRGHRPHDPYYEDDRRHRYPDDDRGYDQDPRSYRREDPNDDWGYDHDPRSYRREDPNNDYPGGRHPAESRYDEDYYPRQPGYDRGAYDDSPERYYEGGRGRGYLRQHSDPRHGRGSQAYGHPQYR